MPGWLWTRKCHSITNFWLIRFFNFLLSSCSIIVFRQKLQQKKPRRIYHIRSSYRCSVRKVANKKFGNLTEKHLCWSLFILKKQAFRLLMIYFTWQNFAREKWWRSGGKFARFFFALYCGLFLMCKGSQTRVYADLLRF